MPINQGLLSQKQKTIHSHYHHGQTIDPFEWARPYWLGSGLFLILLAFWLLDSLKDPIFVKLVDGKISQHQPLAKLCSVFVTLALVCIFEFWMNYLQQQKRTTVIQKENEITPDENVLGPGGVWKRIEMKTVAFSFSSRQFHDEQNGSSEHAIDDIVSFDIFYYIGIPYSFVFLSISYFVWQFEQKNHQQIMLTNYSLKGSTSQIAISVESETSEEENPLGYYILGYIIYATVESFGSLAVATFWSYTNSTLNLQDAERYYGPIIATAQLGAIGGSTLVASGRWESYILLVVVSLVIIMQLLLMRGYDRRFEPTSILITKPNSGFGTSRKRSGGSLNHDDDSSSVMMHKDGTATLAKPFWSGLYLVLNHSYVLLILGVSCIYEVAMTLLDYQMKLLGVAKFGTDVVATTKATVPMSFTKFMGHYGQLVNVTSLIFSSLLFPFLIRHFGLRKTLLCFPTMLLMVTFLAYWVLPGNLTVLFVSLSLLKAMSYSIHDPSKELLYIPTSNAIKFRAKFWIDVVGERISKATGSAFNTLAKNIQQSIKIGSVPSLLSALGLWLVCYFVGEKFDKLLATGQIIGLEYSKDPSIYSLVPRVEHNNNDRYHGRHYDCYRDYFGDEPLDVETRFDEDNVSTLELMTDLVHPRFQDASMEGKSVGDVEMPSLSLI